MDGGGVPHPTPTAAPGLPHTLRSRPGPEDGPGRPRERVSAAAAEPDLGQPSARRPATVDHFAPSSLAPHCKRLSAPSFPSHHSRVCFTILTEERVGSDAPEAREGRLGGREGVAWGRGHLVWRRPSQSRKQMGG